MDVLTVTAPADQGKPLSQRKGVVLSGIPSVLGCQAPDCLLLYCICYIPLFDEQLFLDCKSWGSEVRWLFP